MRPYDERGGEDGRRAGSGPGGTAEPTRRRGPGFRRPAAGEWRWARSSRWLPSLWAPPFRWAMGSCPAAWGRRPPQPRNRWRSRPAGNVRFRRQIRRPCPASDRNSQCPTGPGGGGRPPSIPGLPERWIPGSACRRGRPLSGQSCAGWVCGSRGRRRASRSGRSTSAWFNRGLRRLARRVEHLPRNARLLHTAQGFRALPASPGRILDRAAARQRAPGGPGGAGVSAFAGCPLARKASADPSSPSLRPVPPTVMAAHLGAINTLLATYSTGLGGSSRNRRHNIHVACAAIDGTVLMPGDVFSYNETVGPRTERAGFRTAPVDHPRGVGARHRRRGSARSAPPSTMSRFWGT